MQAARDRDLVTMTQWKACVPCSTQCRLTYTVRSAMRTDSTIQAQFARRFYRGSLARGGMYSSIIGTFLARVRHLIQWESGSTHCMSSSTNRRTGLVYTSSAQATLPPEFSSPRDEGSSQPHCGPD